MRTPRIQTWSLCGTKAFLNMRDIPTGKACSDELRTNLHISSTTAQNIVNYRIQHGSYSSIDQLLQVVSKSIYDRIKDLVTIS